MNPFIRRLALWLALLAVSAVAAPERVSALAPSSAETVRAHEQVASSPAPAVEADSRAAPAWTGALRFLTHPLVAAVLLACGLLGLVMEMKTPSFGLAGAAGLGALALFFAGHVGVGLAGPELILLFAAGLALLAVEAFVLPGFGVAGVLGGLAVVSSLVLTLLGTAPTAVDLAQAGATILTALVLFGVAVWQLLERLPGSGRGQLLASTRRDQGYVASTARVELIGVEGVAVTDLHPSGTARFGEERVDVVTEGDFVQAGTRVRVVRAEGYRHVVRVAG